MVGNKEKLQIISIQDSTFHVSTFCLTNKHQEYVRRLFFSASNKTSKLVQCLALKTDVQIKHGQQLFFARSDERRMGQQLAQVGN